MVKSLTILIITTLVGKTTNQVDERLISVTLLTLHHQFTVSTALPFPKRFPDQSGLYTHVIGKLLHVCSKQKLSQYK